MDKINEFFKPEISKIIIFLLLILIFGIPAFVTQCATYDFGTGEFPCGSPKFTLHNPLIKEPVLDAADIYDYSPFLIILYAVTLYSLLSLIYLYTKNKKAQRIVYIAAFIILFAIMRIWISIL